MQKREARRRWTRPAFFFAVERADTTSTVANWVWRRHFAIKEFCRLVQEN